MRLARNASAVSRNAASTRGRATRPTRNPSRASGGAHAEFPADLVACRAMVIASFWTDHRNLITAIVTLLVAFLLAQLIDRAIQHRGARLVDVMPGQLSPTASTRLR